MDRSEVPLRTRAKLLRELGVARLVHTSTAGTCGPVPGRRRRRPTGRRCGSSASRTSGRNRRRAARARGRSRRGRRSRRQPTTPVGNGDRLPTPTGRMIRGVASGRFRAFTDTGLNVVEVRDVARGHVLALERGRRGDRYILGGADLTLGELFAAVADLAGVARPRLRVPLPAVRLLGLARVANPHEVTLARVPAYVS